MNIQSKIMVVYLHLMLVREAFKVPSVIVSLLDRYNICKQVSTHNDVMRWKTLSSFVRVTHRFTNVNEFFVLDLNKALNDVICMYILCVYYIRDIVPVSMKQHRRI